MISMHLIQKRIKTEIDLTDLHKCDLPIKEYVNEKLSHFIMIGK